MKRQTFYMQNNHDKQDIDLTLEITLKSCVFALDMISFCAPVAAFIQQPIKHVQPPSFVSDYQEQFKGTL